MNRPPLGQVCIELGFLREEQVERILTDMRTHGQGRFGELAVGLNLLAEDQLTRALAHQFGLTRLAAERVALLDVPREVLGLLPVGLMRGRVLLPTFFDADRRILSLVTSDPTDLPALQAAQRHARADRLRLFVAGRSVIAAQLDRLLPATEPTEISSPSFEGLPARGGSVVMEPDLELAAALRRLERAEGGRTEIVSDPEQVTSLLVAGLADRVLYRQALAETVAPYLPVWRRARPGVHVGALRGHGPGQRIAVSYPRARRFYQELLHWFLCASEERQLHERERMRRAWRLAGELGAALDLPEEARELVSLAALMANVGELSLTGRAVEAPAGSLNLYDEPATLLQRFDPPWDVAGLYAALDRRVNRPAEVTERLEVEVLLVVRSAVEAGVDGQGDAREMLPDGIRFHPRVVDALTRVLQRRSLRARLLTGGRRRAVVVAAVRDSAVLAELERCLDLAGPDVVSATSADLALARIRALRPAAVVVCGDLPPIDGADAAVRLLAEVRNDTPLAETPVFALASARVEQQEALAGLGATQVLPPPFDLDGLLARLRVALATGAPDDDRSATVMGEAALLPLAEVVRILELSQQTAEIRLFAAEAQGTVHLVRGERVACRLGRREGEEAWRAALELPHVRYAVAFGVLPATLEGPAAGAGAEG